MKSKYLFIILSLILFSSCNKFKGFTIDGTVLNANGTQVALEDISTNNVETIDTVTIVNNKFHIKNYSLNKLMRLRFGDKKDIIIYVENGDKLEVSLDLNQFPAYEIKGNKGSEDLAALNAIANEKAILLDSAYSEFKNNTNAKLKDSLDQNQVLAKENYVNAIKSFIEKEDNVEVACFGLNYLASFFQDEAAFFIKTVDKAVAKDKESTYVNLWSQSLQSYKDALMQEQVSGVAVGSKAPNIMLPSPNGDTLSLYDLKGKYVLIDFWASWCGPCRQENPNVVKTYNKYKDKGFEIFSVSLDNNLGPWKNAIAKDGLVWKNHVSDLKGWSSVAAQTYGVQSIPSTFLLDKNLVIIQKNLRGKALEEALKDLLKEEN
ncbi:MAG: AhpC/TSA family protein [Chitinophagales bacterium]|nr:AhpC/TSA family protein [Chitinophagales bacterium]